MSEHQTIFPSAAIFGGGVIFALPRAAAVEAIAIAIAAAATGTSGFLRILPPFARKFAARTSARRHSLPGKRVYPHYPRYPHYPHSPVATLLPIRQKAPDCRTLGIT